MVGLRGSGTSGNWDFWRGETSKCGGTSVGVGSMGARSPGWLDFSVRWGFLGMGLLSVVGLLRDGTSDCVGGTSDGVGMLGGETSKCGISGGWLYGGWEFWGMGLLVAVVGFWRCGNSEGTGVTLLSVGLLAGGSMGGEGGEDSGNVGTAEGSGIWLW